MKTSTTALMGGLLLAFALQAPAQTAPAAPAAAAAAPVFLKKADTQALASGQWQGVVAGIGQ